MSKIMNKIMDKLSPLRYELKYLTKEGVEELKEELRTRREGTDKLRIVGMKEEIANLSNQLNQSNGKINDAGIKIKRLQKDNKSLLKLGVPKDPEAKAKYEETIEDAKISLKNWEKIREYDIVMRDLLMERIKIREDFLKVYLKGGKNG